MVYLLTGSPSTTSPDWLTNYHYCSFFICNKQNKCSISLCDMKIILILNHMYWGKSHKLKRQHNNNYHILVALSLFWFLLVPMRVKLRIKLRRESSTTEASKASVVGESFDAEVEVVRRWRTVVRTSTFPSMVGWLALLLLLVLLWLLVTLETSD